jgi:threonine/homoserine/homoserine lactone efflux protein
MWKAFLFGAIVAASIGPIALLIFSLGARQGLTAGAFAGLGAALADGLYALAAFVAGALVLPLLAAYEPAIQLGCALLLVGLGAWMLVGQLRCSEAPVAPLPALRYFLPTFLLTIVNPMTLVVFAGIVPQLPVAGSFASAASLALALGSGSAVVQVAIAGSGALVGRAVPGDGWRRAISAASAIGILAFGIAGLAAG